MFTTPKKTADGRYYVKCTEKKLVQCNGVTLASTFADPASVTFALDPVSWAKISEMNDVILQAAKDNRELWCEETVNSFRSRAVTRHAPAGSSATWPTRLSKQPT